MRSETVDFFGDKMEWVAPHMGTDVALMLGIAHTLVENGWHDEAFLARCTMQVMPSSPLICWAKVTNSEKRRMGSRDLWCWRSENPRAGGYFP